MRHVIRSLTLMFFSLVQYLSKIFPLYIIRLWWLHLSLLLIDMALTCVGLNGKYNEELLYQKAIKKSIISSPKEKW